MRDEVAILERRRREPVQEENGGQGGRAGGAVEDGGPGGKTDIIDLNRRAGHFELAAMYVFCI